MKTLFSSIRLGELLVAGVIRTAIRSTDRIEGCVECPADQPTRADFRKVAGDVPVCATHAAQAEFLTDDVTRRT